jgi:hypothetical protein
MIRELKLMLIALAEGWPGLCLLLLFVFVALVVR